MKKVLKTIILIIIVLMSIFSVNVYATQNQTSDEQIPGNLLEIKEKRMDVKEEYIEKYGQEEGMKEYWKHKISIYFIPTVTLLSVVVGIILLILLIKIIKGKNKKKQNFQNIYTGEKVKDKFESLGYVKYIDSNKRIHLKYNESETTFDYSTNTEYSYNDLKFVICRVNEENLIILFNVDMKENIAHRKLRENFAGTWTYFKSAYRFNINEILDFEFEDNKIRISIN